MMRKKLIPAVIAATTLLLPLAGHAQTSQTYAGNGATGFGGPLGNGNLVVDSSATNGTVTFTLNNSGGFSGNDVVLYIDNGAAGGFSDTSQFQDNGDGGREAVSGYNAGNPSSTVATFAPGFSANEALEFENDTYIGLFGLAAGGNNSLNYITGATPGTAGGPYSLTLTDAQLGVTPGQTFQFVGTLISTSAYRSNESIGDIGTIGNPGFAGPITFANSEAFTVAGGRVVPGTPEPSGVASLLIGFGALAAAVARRRTSRRSV